VCMPRRASYLSLRPPIAAVMGVRAAATLVVLVVLAAALPAAAQPFTYSFATPLGLEPGAPLIVEAELRVVSSEKPSYLFVYLFSIPVSFTDDTESTQYVRLYMLTEIKNSLELIASLLEERVFSGAWDEYGYALSIKRREPGVHRGSMGLRVPEHAECGNVLFAFLYYATGAEYGALAVPVGVVCESKLRRGVYYESYVAELRGELESLRLRSEQLRGQLDAAVSDRDRLRAAVERLQGEVKELQGENAQLREQLGRAQTESAELRARLAQLQEHVEELQGESAQLKAREQLLLALLAALLAALAALAVLALRRRPR